MQAALLGLSHPHSAALLKTLDNLREISRIILWDEILGTENSLPRSGKVSLTTTDLSQVLECTAVSFVILCVPHHQSAVLAQKVIAAGKHLLAEKPVGRTAAEIFALHEAAARAGVVASVLYPRRVHDCTLAARRLISAGKLGSPYAFEARFLTTQVRFRDPTHWLFDRAKSGGGILLWLGCHYLDLLQFVADDEIIAVSALLARRSPERINVEDTAMLTLMFRSGAIGTFHSSYALAFSGSGYVNPTGYDAYLAWNGQTGRVTWPSLKPLLHLEYLNARGSPVVRDRRFTQRASTSYGGTVGERFIRQFIAAVLRRSSPPTTLLDADRTARIIHAAESSAHTGRLTRVKSPRVRSGF